MVMMLREFEDSLIAPFSTLQKPSDTSHRCGTGTCLCRNHTIGFALNDSLCNLEPLTPRLKFRECAHIPQEIRDFSFVLTRCDRRAEGTEPRVLSPIAFGERFSSHAQRILTCS